MPEKKFYRCNVCGDIHWGVMAPEVCPTCKQLNTYIEIEQSEAEKIIAQ